MEHFKKLILPEVVEITGLFAGLIWIIHYWFVSGFGLYEDDITHVPTAVSMTWVQLFNYVKFNFANFGVIDKPLHYSLIYTLSKLGYLMAGLPGIYALGFLILTANSILMYALLYRLSNRTMAVIGSLFFCLFFADTTQAFITHSFGLQTSLMLFLVATHLYLSQRSAFSYIFLILTLITYETVFPLFLAVPLLGKAWNKRLLRPIITNTIVMAIIISGDFFYRRLAGENRVATLNIKDAIQTSFIHMIQGPTVALGTYLLRPFQGLLKINWETAIIIVIILLVLSFVLIKMDDPLNNMPGVKPPFHFLNIYKELPEDLQSFVRLAIIGLAMLILAYPLTFTIRAYAISGRDTRVHFAAVVGASIFCGSVFNIFLSLLHGYNQRKIAKVFLAVWFSLLAGFGFVVQNDYVQAWQNEKDFWTQLLPQIQDVNQGTVILIDPNGLRDTRQIGANTWNLPRVLNQIYTFPADWKNPPRVYRLNPGWDKLLVNDQGLFSQDGHEDKRKRHSGFHFFAV